MRIILRKDVSGLGKKGDIMDVSDGYARNYLVPRGEALQATAGAERQATTMQKSRAVQDTRELEAAQAMSSRFAGASIRIAARASEAGKLFGSVSENDIALAAVIQVQARLDKKDITMAEPIKDLGMHTVTASPHPDVTFPIMIDVVADEG